MNYEVLIIGTDTNAYYMARSFHEWTGEKAKLLGHNPLPFTAYSDILTVTYNPSIWEEQGFLSAIRDFKAANGNRPTILISSNETYAGFIAANSDTLKAEGFLFNYADKGLLETFMYKDVFYKTYADSCLDLPYTLYYDCANPAELPEDLPFPLIVKPSDVISYNHLSFAGKNKIYKLNNRAELMLTVKHITEGGYRGQLILQDFIPGDDSCLFDAVTYCDTNGKVCFLTFAQIGLQEHTRSMVGNAAVLINGYNQYGETELTVAKLKRFLETVGYRGFAEFDLKYDRRDGKFKVLEINARQGRCSYYICPLGYNPVQLLAEDLCFGKSPEFKLLNEPVLLSFVPRKIAKKYITNPAFLEQALSLWKHAPVNPLHYEKDKNLKRKLYLLKRKLRYYKDYQSGYWKVD